MPIIGGNITNTSLIDHVIKHSKFVMYYFTENAPGPRASSALGIARKVLCISDNSQKLEDYPVSAAH